MKSWSKIALIPAYNPEYCLVDLVQTLKKKGFWILVVDDGSSEAVSYTHLTLPTKA